MPVCTDIHAHTFKSSYPISENMEYVFVVSVNFILYVVHLVEMYYISIIFLSVDGHLSCFLFLAVMNIVIMNISEQISL